MDEQTLWRLRAAGDAAARAELVARHLPLAQSLARRYARSGEPLDDLEQVAYVGLVHAVARFEPARGVAFSSFAVPTILGELKRRTWALRVPREVRDAVVAVERASQDLSSALGRSPSAGELATATGLGVERVLDAREAGALDRAEDSEAP